MKTKLIFYPRNAYGKIHFYAHNEPAKAIQTLLGQKSLSTENIAALALLEPYGMTVELISEPINSKAMLENAINKVTKA